MILLEQVSYNADDDRKCRRQELRSDHAGPEAGMMNAELLIAEGRRLARPCVHLVDQPAGSTEIIGAWGGPGIIQKPDGVSTHRLTVRCESLPQGLARLPGCIGIYELQDTQDQGFIAIHLPEADLPDIVLLEGTPLYGSAALSLPPIEAVMRFGSPMLHTWLREHGIDPADTMAGFPDLAMEDAYIRVWQDNCPIYSSGMYATLGGWHFPWPDGDWFDFLSKTLLILTLEDAEPWLEVWADDAGELLIVERIT